MWKSVAGAFVGLVIVAGSLLVCAQPSEAAAGNPACMSRVEYRKIHTGQTPAQVKRIVGSSGKLAMGSSWLNIRQWKVCGNPYGIGQVAYSGGRVDNKLMI